MVALPIKKTDPGDHISNVPLEHLETLLLLLHLGGGAHHVHHDACEHVPYAARETQANDHRTKKKTVMSLAVLYDSH